MRNGNLRILFQKFVGSFSDDPDIPFYGTSEHQILLVFIEAFWDLFKE
jgi:hypothetical protein